jgi:tRNA (mo5U34)-methyltransferase
MEALGPWFHNLHLPDGTETAPDHPLGDFPSFKWSKIGPALPADLSGWTALDIGCNGGFYTLELARRDARVTAVDYDPHYLAQARWAAELMGLTGRIELREEQVYGLGRSEERFDLVWFMGVIYHLRYPLLALDMAARCTRRLLVFQTLTMPEPGSFEAAPDYGIAERAVLAAPGWPKMAFIEKRFANDPTNWWAPNAACAEAMLRSSGMRILSRPADETWICEPDPEGRARELNEAEYRAALGR